MRGLQTQVDVLVILVYRYRVEKIAISTHTHTPPSSFLRPPRLAIIRTLHPPTSQRGAKKTCKFASGSPLFASLGADLGLCGLFGESRRKVKIQGSSSSSEPGCDVPRCCLSAPGGKHYSAGDFLLISVKRQIRVICKQTRGSLLRQQR